MAEFLPLCDVLFNVISLAGYFCDVVFDVVMGYALLERGYKRTFAAAMSIIVTSLIISQVLSLRWYVHLCSQSGGKGRPPWLPVALHALQLGVLWRYARLFVPVDLRHVKHQVRDLCMLRLVHAFCEAAPMLLLQLHVYLSLPREDLDLPAEPTRDEPAAHKAFEELNVISASLSMFSVCWALASFSKNVRLQNVHRLVLTWLGVIFQFLWRLGTISARICALTLYALVYEYWVFLVIGLHWVSMYLWLISPKNVFHGERISRPRKAYLSALIAYVYVFAYINLQELNHRQKMVTFYSVMMVENCVLVCAWWSASPTPQLHTTTPLLGFIAGLGFMVLYYRYFHVRRLGYLLGENQQGTNSTNASSQSKHGKQSVQADNAAIPGVFNCRFTNPVGGPGRKRKKPTSFVPPPPAPATAFWRRPLSTLHHHHGGSSSNEGSSVGSRVNIQQKLQEKKQKQLAELRVIEEEIKQGKLNTTSVAPEEIYTSLQREPIPRAKSHGEPPQWNGDIQTHSYQNYPSPYNCNIYPTYTEIKPYPLHYTKNEDLNTMFERSYYETPIQVTETQQNTENYEDKPKFENQSLQKEFPTENTLDFSRFQYPLLSKRVEQVKKLQRSRTPEILLSPQYLEGLRQQSCCHWDTPLTCSGVSKEDREGVSSGGDSVGDVPRGPSDIDSQISLPRSYTLPREFRYWKRRTRSRHTHAPSNNSSDGDVDSGDNDSDGRSDCSASSQNHHVYNDPYTYNTQRPDLLSRTQDEDVRRSHEAYIAGAERSRRHNHRKHTKPETQL